MCLLVCHLLFFVGFSGSSHLCYTCPKASSMEECNAQMTQYNCSNLGAYHKKCARFCDWKNGVYTRECAMEHKCTVIQRECKEREDMKKSKQKEPECEYKCCDGELCNTDPCSVGQSLRLPLRSIVGLSTVYFIFIICFD